MGEGPYSYVERWLTKLCWEEDSDAARAQSAARRLRTVLVFDDDEGARLVGFAAWELTDEEISGRRVGLIELIGVVLDRRRQGIARDLVSRCQGALIEAHGSDNLILKADVATDNSTARSVFEQGLGFRRYRTTEAGYETLIVSASEYARGA
jgi:GNAT superfamily N-acetyltransferase